MPVGDRFVLRRPPLGHLLPSAHDVAREHRLMDALAGTDAVPVPRMVGLCQDPAGSTGVTFYVMEHLDGVVVRDGPTLGTGRSSLRPGGR